MADKSLTLGTIFTADIRQFIANVEAIKTQIKTLGTQMSKTGVATTAAATATTRMASAQKKATTAVKKVGDAHAFTGKQIASVSGAMNRLKAAMKVTASYGLASRAIFGVYEALSAGTREIIDFDQALKNLQAISGATDAQVSVMGDSIKDVARTTKFSTVEVAEGMVLLTQAGFTEIGRAHV